MRTLLTENIRISLESIRSHLLRTILTILIIGFGIMALVGILTAIDAMKVSLTDQFSMMGSNTFSIRNRGMRVHIGGKSTNPRYHRSITYKEALEFKERFTYPAVTSIFTWGTGIGTVKYKSEKSNPNVQVLGIDEDYLTTAGQELLKGRIFTPDEVFYGNHVAIIGSEIEKILFKDKEDPIDKIISIGSGKYKVIGVLEEKGSSMGFSPDRRCYVPLNNARQYYSYPNKNFTINIMSQGPDVMDAAIGEAAGLFRIVRGDRLGEEDSFDISKSDSIAEMLIDSLSYVTIAATLIGLITLIGAAIGLMNIMLVSVTERTREIGVRKALGATRRTIRNQFQAEAVVIAQMGGLLGILLGIGIGNIVSVLLKGPFIVPWPWIILGIVLCFIVSLASGIIPASKAANLDPIESLRYE